MMGDLGFGGGAGVRSGGLKIRVGNFMRMNFSQQRIADAVLCKRRVAYKCTLMAATSSFVPNQT